MPADNEYYRRYRAEHRHYFHLYDFHRTAKMKLLVFSHYSPTNPPSCTSCGIDDLDVLCLDHVHNDGYKQRRHIGNGQILYRWIKKNNYPEGYQVLCYNCNQKKRMKELKRIRVKEMEEET